MKVFNAYTLEVDDPAVAVGEILEQLDLDNQLLSHSVGFITCGHDYVDTGMVKAICAALPFEVVGCTTLTNANCREAGTMLLCLTVLTADDCRFVTAASPPLGDDPAEAAKTIGRTCREAVSRLGESPALTLAFLGITAQGLGYAALRWLPAFKVGLIGSLELPAGAVLSWLLFNDPMSPRTLFGGLMIVFAVFQLRKSGPGPGPAKSAGQ